MEEKVKEDAKKVAEVMASVPKDREKDVALAGLSYTQGVKAGLEIQKECKKKQSDDREEKEANDKQGKAAVL